ncbi:MAG: septum formation initiator family protein [Minwuia sp.]|nr:septum formation initiator family protein [Minwuia sp.]
MKIKSRITRNLPLLLGALCVGYFGFHATWGDRGLLATESLQARTVERTAHLAMLEQQQAVLQRRVRLMSGPAVDADILDEQVRRVLGWTLPEDIVILEKD